MRKAFFGYPWVRSSKRRSYLLGCLKAFLKSGFERKFYDLGRVKYWGPQSVKKVDFGFDTTRRAASANTTTSITPRARQASMPMRRPSKRPRPRQ